MRKVFRPYIVSVVLAAIFFATGFFFLEKFEKYLQLRTEVRSSQVTLRLLEKREREMERKKRILARVRSFVDKARSLGLEKERWDTYEVEIKNPVSYEKAADILNQTVSTGSYYFKPVHLRITKDLKAAGATEGQEQQPQSETPGPSGNGDVYLNLKGSFLARAR